MRGMPRFKSTRMLLILILIICLTLLFVNLWFDWKTDKNYDFNNNNINGDRSVSAVVTSLQKSGIRQELNEIRSENKQQNNVFTRNLINYEMNILNNNQNKPWFLSNGTVRPSPELSSNLVLWPEQSSEDRIVNQLMYLPKHYNPNDNKLKTIVLYLGRGGWADLPMGRKKFIVDKCPVDRCFLSANPNDAVDADAVFFKERFQWPKHRRPSYQIWILFLLECPLHTQLFRNLGAGVFNWTATYRHDSDIVAPYEKFVAYNRNVGKSTNRKNWSEGKSKQVAWLVSNCGARNKRLEFARELSRYIQVDIYGSCGNKKCPRNTAKHCFEMLNRDYKFYLAFENSNCRDYITEKFFINGLGHNMVEYNLIPIVMGAHPNDYLRASPHKSYIHVDDFESPKQLAQYLHKLSSDPNLYNKYFEWKSSGEFINTYFWCRVCALLHSPEDKPSGGYTDISKWWSPEGICINGKQKWGTDSTK